VAAGAVFSSWSGVSAVPTGDTTENFHLAPNTVVLDGARLLETKLQLFLEPWNQQLKTALSDLTTQAESWLGQGPWSVTTSPKTPPRDLHDYASQAPYYWPSNTTDGCPYVNRDGVVNPETLLYTDHANRGTMFQASYILSLAWFYTGNETYGRHAGNILRTWFLANDTRMNPNLDHAQIIPCQDTGRSIGIIDFSQEYTSILDAAAILAYGAPGWTESDVNGFREWNVEFLNWLVNSPFGIEELAAENNHGTFASMQIAGIALFVGKTTLAKQQVLDTETRINDYITANGSQPLELVRTRSWHYSTFDLVAYTRLAAIGQHVGVDLWRYEGPQGQSIDDAVDFIIPAASNSTPWAYPELDFLAYGATDIIHAAADAGNEMAKAAVSKLQSPPGGDLWLLRPASEQLDAITTPSSLEEP
jgi:hypothetical protein